MLPFDFSGMTLFVFRLQAAKPELQPEVSPKNH